MEHLKKLLIISTFLISTIFFIDNVEAKTVSYVYNDTEYNFDIDELAQTYGHEATGNYVLTANSGYFKKGEDIENFFILIEIKNSILTLEPTISDVGTNNKINGTIYFANVSSTTYSENDSSTLSIKYNLASKEFSINKNDSGGVGFSGILKTNMPYFYGRTNGKLINNKRYTLLKNLIYDYDSLEYFTYNFEDGERFIFPKLKDYYFLSSTNYDEFIVSYSDSPSTYNTSSNTINYSNDALIIKYYNNTDLPYEAYDISYYNSAIYNGDYLYSNYDIYDENGNIVDLNPVPTISIKKESENSIEINGTEYITDITLNIEFSSIDNDKYYYLYKYGSSSEWSQMILEQSNSFSKTFSTNDIFYVQVLDKTTQETVSSATYTIDNINYDGKPYITIGLVDSENENICITENGKHICENLVINSHIDNFQQYSLYIINHATNETIRKFDSIVKHFVYENTTIEARIVDNYTNEIVDKKTYTISSISSDSSMGQHITSDCYFATYGTNYLCNFYFYNYDSNSYKYYIGTNTSNFVELLNNNTGTWLNNKLINFYLVQDNLAKLHEFSINENTTFYFKIVDKETDEIIYTKTFTIPYNKKLEESEKTNLFDIFKNFINKNENLKNIINQIWTNISSSAIYEYILILIIGTLIVLIIKAANR